MAQYAYLQLIQRSKRTKRTTFVL